MQPLTLSLDESRPFLVATLFLWLSVTLLLSLDAGDTAMGLGVRAFPLRDVANVARSSRTRPHQNQRRQHGWYSTNEELVLAATPLCDEDINGTSVEFDVGFPDSSFLSDDFLSSSTGLSETPPMTLKRKGGRLELSPNTKDQPTIVIFDGLSPDTWTTVEAPKTSAPAAASSSFSSVVLQTKIPSVPIESLPLGDFLVSSDASSSHQQQQQHSHKFLAASRLNRYWMGPKFGGDASGDLIDDKDRTKIPVDTQYLLVEIERDAQPPYYAVMMPLVDGGFRSSLEPSSSSIGNHLDEAPGDHHLTLVSYSESGEMMSPPDRELRNAMYVAVHDDPYELLRLAFREVSGVLGGTFRTLDEKKIPSEFVNSFGWCSWDAFYSKVHPSGILKGVQCLSDAGIPVKNVILDDGWQQVSPPYLHQQEEAEDKKKKTSALAASLSLSGSSDIMPPPSSMEVSSVSSSGAASAAAAIAVPTSEEASSGSSALEAIASNFRDLFQNPLEALSNIGGSVFGVIASGVTSCYQKYVEKAPPGSLPNRLWTFLARYSPLNQGLWQFFESETDFGRQLNDFDPNWKFLDEKEEVSHSTKTKKNIALKELVGTLKNDWKVNKVYCWHSIHGYWRGVSDELGKSIGIQVTQVRTRPSDHVLRIEPEMAYDPPSLFGVGLIGDKGDLTKFYKHLHEPLAAAGIDGVKVDVQSGITAAGMRGRNIKDCPPLAKLYTQTMEDSVLRRFPSARSDKNSVDAGAVECINCMCHSTENLYRYKTTAVARASDDFYPARPESHTVHLVNVAYNSMFLGEICLPDWDMFHSQHASAELHAAARAIGGCPVYVSDVPGKHNVPLLKKLVLPDGSVLRAKKAGRPTRDCIFADVGKDGTSALKVWNVNRESSIPSKASGGVLGAFNVQGVAWNFETNENQILETSPPPVTAFVRPHDVDSLRKIKGPFAVWSHQTRSLTILSNGDSAIATILAPRDWEIFTIQPVQQIHFDSSSSGTSVRWAPIGLGHMLNSGGAIIDVGRLSKTDDDEIVAFARGNESRPTRIQADTTVRGPGLFVAYCQPRPSNVLIRNGLSPKQLEFRQDPQSGLLEIDLPQEAIDGKAHLVTVIWDK